MADTQIADDFPIENNYDFFSKIEDLYKLNSFENTGEFGRYRDILFKALSSDIPFAYAMFTDTIIRLIELPILNTAYVRPPTNRLIDFLGSMHLHGVPLEDRSETAKRIINLYSKLYFSPTDKVNK